VCVCVCVCLYVYGSLGMLRRYNAMHDARMCMSMCTCVRMWMDAHACKCARAGVGLPAREESGPCTPQQAGCWQLAYPGGKWSVRLPAREESGSCACLPGRKAKRGGWTARLLARERFPCRAHSVAGQSDPTPRPPGPGLVHRGRWVSEEGGPGVEVGGRAGAGSRYGAPPCRWQWQWQWQWRQPAGGPSRAVQAMVCSGGPSEPAPPCSPARS